MGKYNIIILFFFFISFSCKQLRAETEIQTSNEKTSVPDITASDISFDDLDPEIRKLMGVITISPSEKEENISHYMIYWGRSKDKKHNNTPIAEVPADDKKVTFEFKESTDIPQKPKATHLLVYTKNKFGEMGSGIAEEIKDKGAAVLIKAGSFIMGSDSGKADEKPPHKVTIKKDFYVLDHEVTASEYSLCVENNGCAYNGSKTSPLRTYKVSGKERYPINYVSWFDAGDYALWFSRKSNLEYRLCTESEWEYFARAGSKTSWSCGVNSQCTESSEWFGDSSENAPYETMMGKPNPWGIYDVHDNIFEWILDWYKPYPVADAPEFDTKDSEKGSARVIRGGTFKHTPANLRSSTRAYLSPGDRLSFLGIRLCANIK